MPGKVPAESRSGNACAAVGTGSSLSSPHLAFHPSASLDHAWLGVPKVTVGSLSTKILVLLGGVCVVV